MANASYPTGVENHGGSLRIWFLYKGKRVRENLGIPDTAKNRKIAGELRSSVCFAIRMGNFNYVEKFPNSPNLARFGQDRKEITVLELTERWSELKRMEISSNTMSRYESIIKNMLPLIGENKMVSAVTTEDLLYVRKELLTGFQVMKKDHRTQVKGRKSSTVNNYMMLICPITAPKHGSSAVEILKFKGLAVASLHFYNMGHEMRSTLKTAYGVIGVQ